MLYGVTTPKEILGTGHLVVRIVDMMFIIVTYGVTAPKEILGTSHLVVRIVTMVVHRLKIHLEGYLGTRHLVVMSVLIMMLWIFLHRVFQ